MMQTPEEKLASLYEELTKVNAAIDAAYVGAEYDIESGNSRRRLKRQSLDALLKRKGDLETQIGRMECGGRSNVRHSLPCP